MAVDTRNKRFSLLGLAVPILLVLPAPDAAINQADRQQLAYCYAGIAADSPVVVENDVVNAECAFARTVTCEATFARTASTCEATFTRTVEATVER